MDARELLGKATFFAEVLGGPELDALALVARRADYDRGATLMREGEQRELAPGHRERHGRA